MHVGARACTRARECFQRGPYIHTVAVRSSLHPRSRCKHPMCVCRFPAPARTPGRRRRDRRTAPRTVVTCPGTVAEKAAGLRQIASRCCAPPPRPARCARARCSRGAGRRCVRPRADGALGTVTERSGPQPYVGVAGAPHCGGARGRAEARSAVAYHLPRCAPRRESPFSSRPPRAGARESRPDRARTAIPSLLPHVFVPARASPPPIPPPLRFHAPERCESQADAVRPPHTANLNGEGFPHPQNLFLPSPEILKYCDFGTFEVIFGLRSEKRGETKPSHAREIWLGLGCLGTGRPLKGRADQEVCDVTPPPRQRC